MAEPVGGTPLSPLRLKPVHEVPTVKVTVPPWPVEAPANPVPQSNVSAVPVAPAGTVEALLSEETTKLKIDPETLSHLLAPLD